MPKNQKIAATLLVARPAQAAKLPTAPGSGFYDGHMDPFYNIQCDLLSPAEEQAFGERMKRTGDNWAKGWKDLAAEKLGDTPFVVLALRDSVVVGWLRFYRAGMCNLRAEVKTRPVVDKALVVGAACITADELAAGTVPHMIDKVAEQAKQLRLADIFAIASPDIRAYSNWCNQFMLKDYRASGFGVVEQTPPVDDGALRCMAQGNHGKTVQASLLEDGITDSFVTRYYLMRKACK